MCMVINILITSIFERKVLVQYIYLYWLINLLCVLECHVSLTEGGNIFKRDFVLGIFLFSFIATVEIYMSTFKKSFIIWITYVKD